MKPRHLLSLVAVVALLPATAAAQSALVLGSVVSGQVGSMGPAEFTLDIGEPGFLSVVIRSASETDLVLMVTDDEGQLLPDARSDSDRGGDMSAEQLMVQIPWAGGYTVVVEQNYSGGSASFQIGASFLPTELAGAEPDPDGKPSEANVVTVGEGHEDAIDPENGDGWDWFSLSADGPGVLTVLTRALDDMGGDLRLEVFRADDLRTAVESSDQDQDGVFANESVTVDVAAGETVFVKVSPSFGGGSRVAYRLASGLIGD